MICRQSSGLLIALLLVASFIAIMSEPASAQETLEVGGGKQYATIQEAIKDAPHGGTILVHPGTYIWTKNIVINKSLTVESIEGAENTIIDCTTLSGNYIISINHSSFTLDGFTVIGKGIIRIKGQKEPTESVSILNNVLIGISGIDLESAAGRISDITIAGNTIENCNYGIRVKGIGHKPSAEPIENVVIENNNILTSYWPAHSVRNYAEAAVNATMNWWGTKVKSEIDEMITVDGGEIIFDPWLDAPYPEGMAMSGGDNPAQSEAPSPMISPNPKHGKYDVTIQVLTVEGLPLENSTVYVDSRVVATGTDGMAELELGRGTYTVRVVKLGYGIETKTIVVKKDAVFQFFLSPLFKPWPTVAREFLESKGIWVVAGIVAVAVLLSSGRR